MKSVSAQETFTVFYLQKLSSFPGYQTLTESYSGGVMTKLENTPFQTFLKMFLIQNEYIFLIKTYKN